MLRLLVSLTFCAALSLSMASAFAQDTDTKGSNMQTTIAVKRLVVFPFLVERDLQKAADEVWWDLREKLTEHKRFLIASKNFMEVKDVFQPRGALTAADAIILGRLLDSHALLTADVKDNRLTMQAYETANGLLLWQRQAEFHPTTPFSKQLPEAARKLVQDFIASVPYHGTVILDSVSNKSVYLENGKNYFRADVGVSPAVVNGGIVQVVRMNPKNLKPQFDEGTTLDIVAEGTITKVDGNIVTVEIKRKRDDFDISANDLVRLPAESKRLQQAYSIRPAPVEIAGAQLLTSTQVPLTDKEKETKPLVTALTFIGSLIGFILIAF